MKHTTVKCATGVASGKIILIGEHAAVYGKPAIAIPCSSVNATTTVTHANKGLYIYCDLFQGFVDNMPELLTSLKIIIHETLHYLNKLHATLHIKIDSSIPIERGMGSSAAVSISIIKALFQYFDKTPTQEELFTLSEISEKLIHGNPSGLDATTIIFEKAMLFQKGHAVQPFSFELGGYLVIADSGITGQTKLAISNVAALKQQNEQLHEQHMSNLECLTTETKQALHEKDISTLGVIFNQAHTILQNIQVSHPFVDDLITCAKEHGALGAKMTGGGLGGCLLALCDTKDKAQTVANALKYAGAKQTFIQFI